MRKEKFKPLCHDCDTDLFVSAKITPEDLLKRVEANGWQKDWEQSCCSSWSKGLHQILIPVNNPKDQQAAIWSAINGIAEQEGIGAISIVASISSAGDREKAVSEFKDEVITNDKSLIYDLSEIARSLGVAQASHDKGAQDEWSKKLLAAEKNLKQRLKKG